MSENTAQTPTLDDIATASALVDGKIPSAVLDAFLPRAETHLGQTLVPIKAGHELLLAQISHPLSTGEPWEDADVLMALFIFSRPSRQLFSYLANDSFEAEFFGFVDSIPSADIPKLGSDMVAHWTRSRATALGMTTPHSSGQKKTVALVGGSTLSARLARCTGGFRTWFFTRFRSPNSSP